MSPKSVLPKGLMFIACALAGCSYTTAIPVTAANPNPSGFRVNAVSTKFLRTPAGLQAVSYSDPCRQYAVRFGAVLAKNESTLTVNENGTLESIALKLDSTDAITLVEKVLDQVPGLDSDKDRDPPLTFSPSQVEVFDIECQPDGSSRLVAADMNRRR